MSTGDYTANLPDQQARDNDDERRRVRRQRRNDQITDTIYQSRIPTLSPGNGTNPRAPFGKTRTLKGAFQAAGSPPPVGAAGNEQKTPPRRARARERKASMTSPMSEISSPPDELIETYQRINDADHLVDYVDQDDYDLPTDQARFDRIRRLSPSPGPRRRPVNEETGAGDTYGSNLGFEDVTDESLRQQLTRHALDDMRLKRVTQRESTVFSKARVGPKAALSFDNLRRQNEEEVFVDDVEPSLNVPKNWGLRGRVSNDWLSNASRPNGNSHIGDESLQLPTQEFVENDVDFTASLQISDSPPVRSTAPARNEIETIPKKGLSTSRLEEIKRRASQEQMRPSIGDVIPNTPVTIFREANREKPRLLNRNDPQDLLRKLSRSENSSATSTPEQTPAEDTLLNAKTPVVTGAWINTPVPDRSADPPQDVSMDINSPSMAAAKVQPKNQRQIEVEQAPPNPPEKSQAPPQPKTETEPETQSQPQPKPKPKRAPLKPLEKPKLPRSALEAVIEDARSGDHSLMIGENTIDSLQELLDENPAFLDSKPYIKPESDEDDETKDGLSTQTDDIVVERLNKKLQSLVKSINATQTGLTSLERQIAKDANLLISRTTKQGKKPLPHRHTTDIPCESCGLHDDGRHYVALPLPRLWYRHPDTNRIRLTRLSWIVLGVLTWYFSELVMCDFYCHPFYASTCERNCLDPNAPRMPWVIPTMLWRWSRLSVILKPVWTLLVAGFRFIAQLLGFWDGFFDNQPEEWAEPLGGYAPDPPTYQPNFDSFDADMDLGMMQDEFV
ncbi:hypothetical protein FQN53_004504 [Emmonsiellopsis sp. PD_33]|nr:hypothetical protein FQN53_004504 [Emmonsiellopsis sp. PD_33]